MTSDGLDLQTVTINLEDEHALSGYLHKKTKDGRWQKRWFETNGIYLTYYKSRKMEKLLAALSLPQVGEIKTLSIDQDPENKGGLFTLELNTRIYTLRAKSEADAELWVNTLRKLKEQGIPETDTNSNARGNPRLLNADNTGGNWVKEKRCCCGLCC